MCVGGGEEIPRTQDLADSLVLSPWIMTSSLTPGWSWGQKMAINLEVYKYICVILVQICKLLIVNWVEFLFLKDNDPLRKKMFYFILVPFVFSRTSEHEIFLETNEKLFKCISHSQSSCTQQCQTQVKGVTDIWRKENVNYIKDHAWIGHHCTPFLVVWPGPGS